VLTALRGNWLPYMTVASFALALSAHIRVIEITRGEKRRALMADLRAAQARAYTVFENLETTKARLQDLEIEEIPPRIREELVTHIEHLTSSATSMEEIRAIVARQIDKADSLPLWRTTARRIERMRSDAEWVSAKIDSAEQGCRTSCRHLIRWADLARAARGRAGPPTDESRGD
jgi:hypothetical protein